jgi:hypothetical protein
MKTHAIYKCQRCGATITSKTVYTAPEDLECADVLITHTCYRLTPDNRLPGSEDEPIREQIGLAKLVGYDDSE